MMLPLTSAFHVATPATPQVLWPFADPYCRQAKTTIEWEIYRSKKMPGPGSYFLTTTHKEKMQMRTDARLAARTNTDSEVVPKPPPPRKAAAAGGAAAQSTDEASLANFVPNASPA